MRTIYRWNLLTTIKAIAIVILMITTVAVIITIVLHGTNIDYLLEAPSIIFNGMILLIIERRTHHFPLVRRTRQLRSKLVRYTSNQTIQPQSLQPLRQFNHAVTRSVLVPLTEAVDVYVLLTGNLGIDTMFWTDADEQQIIKWLSSYNLHFVEREELSQWKRIIHLHFSVIK